MASEPLCQSGFDHVVFIFLCDSWQPYVLPLLLLKNMPDQVILHASVA